MMISTIKHLTFSNLSKCLKCKKSETNIYGYKTNIRILCKCLTNIPTQETTEGAFYEVYVSNLICPLRCLYHRWWLFAHDLLKRLNIMHVSFVETVVLFSTLALCDLAYIWRCIDFISIALWCHDLCTPLLFPLFNFMSIFFAPAKHDPTIICSVQIL